MKRFFTAALLLAAMVIAFHWRLVLTNEYSWLETPGVMEHTLPLLQFQAGEVHKLRLPIWDPYTDRGQTLLAWNLPSPWYPPHLLFLALPLKRGWLLQGALHWYFVLIGLALAAAMVRFARRNLQASMPAAFAAAAAYAFVAPALTRDLAALHAAALIPLAAGFALERDWLRCGFFLGLGWLTGSFAEPLAATAGCAVLLLMRSRAMQAIGAVLLAVATGAAVILPALEFSPSIPLQPLRTGIAPGIVTGILALAGVIAHRHQPVARALAILVAAGILAGSPLTLLFAFAAAAALGADALASQKNLSKWIAITGGLLLIASAIAWTVRLPGFENGGPMLLSGALALTLAAIPAGGASTRTAAGLALLLVVLDAGAWTPWPSRFDRNRPRKMDVMSRDYDIAAFLQRTRGDRPRAMIDPAVIPYDFGRWYGIETAPPGTPDPVQNGIAFWVSREPRYGFDRVLYRGESGVTVYGVDQVPSQLRLVHDQPCNASADYVDYAHRLPTELSVEVRSACPGRLEPGLAYTTGWQIKVDGNPGKYTYLGVDLPAGNHLVELRFRPITLVAGSATTAASLVLAGFVLALRRRNKL